MPRYDDNVRGGGAHSPNERRDRRSIKSPLLDRHRRDSPPQYQSSSSRLGPRDHDRHTGGTGGGGLYHHRESYSSSRSSYHYSREPTNNGPMPYKILCLSNLNSKFPDSTIRNEIEKEFSRFGEPMVKLVYDRTERIAYLYFHSYEDAREAKRANFRLSILDRPLVIEPIYNSVKKRSASPDYHRSMLRSHSPGRRITPTHRGVNERYQLSHLRDYHRDVHNPHSKSDNFSTQLSSRPNPGPNPPIVRENKKDKFPNYLHHIPPEDDDKATRTLFVGNLEVNITEPDLKRIFERYGEVDDIDVKRPPPGQGNAYAFIKFVNLDMAHRAKVEMSGQYIGKFQCKIGYGKATPTTRIWVGGLGSWTNLNLLDKEFDRYGAIRKIDYNKGDNFAYIQYDSLDAAQAACQSMRGYPLGGEDKRLRIDYADPTPTSLSPRPGNDNVNNFNFSGSPRNAQNNNNGNNNNNQLWSGDNYHPSSPKRKRMQNSDGEGSDRKRSPISGLSSPRPDNGDSGENGSPSFDLSNGKSQIKASINETVTSVAELIRCSATAWTGGLVIKSSAFASKACFCCGDFLLVNELMKSDNSATSNVVLRLTQRLRMDPERLDDVSQRISAPDSANKYCMMVVSQATINLTFENYTPGSDGVEASALQTRPIRNLVTYLKSKDAAGVVLLTENPSVSTDELNDAKGVLYIFPPHKFSVDLLRKVAPNLAQDSTEKEDFLVFVLFRGPH